MIITKQQQVVGIGKDSKKKLGLEKLQKKLLFKYSQIFAAVKHARLFVFSSYRELLLHLSTLNIFEATEFRRRLKAMGIAIDPLDNLGK